MHGFHTGFVCLLDFLLFLLLYFVFLVWFGLACSFGVRVCVCKMGSQHCLE